MHRRAWLPIFAAGFGALATAAPKGLPSLAKINGLLDRARDSERKNDYAAVIPVYAAVLAECGDPAPRHLEHVAAKALVQSGNARLALGDLAGAQTSYREAVNRYGKAWEDDTRQHVLRARALIGRVDELRRMMPDASQEVAKNGSPREESHETVEHEPLLLLTERHLDGAGGQSATRGFEVRTFDGDEGTLMRQAELKASREGRKILETGRDMALRRREILPGSCWDYVDAVYTRAGYVERKRQTVFKSVKRGPFVDVGTLQPGDWLYFVNHSFGNIEHSAIFVAWVHPASKVALMLSYPGQNRPEPGRYRPYELTSAYTIIRPASTQAAAGVRERPTLALARVK